MEAYIVRKGTLRLTYSSSVGRRRPSFYRRPLTPPPHPPDCAWSLVRLLCCVAMFEMTYYRLCNFHRSLQELHETSILLVCSVEFLYEEGFAYLQNCNMHWHAMLRVHDLR